MSRLHILAPLSGWSASLDEAPDAVFSQRLLGDGVMLDPTTDTLCAPCDGEVLSVAPTGHAVAMRAENGAEILLHVGIDTVELKGSGFRVLTTPGRRVRAGEPLIAFDLDLIAARAKSLATPIVVTNGERFTIAMLAVDRAVALGEPLFEVVPLATAAAGHAPGAGEALERVTVLHANGIHAR